MLQITRLSSRLAIRQVSPSLRSITRSWSSSVKDNKPTLNTPKTANTPKTLKTPKTPNETPNGAPKEATAASSAGHRKTGITSKHAQIQPPAHTATSHASKSSQVPKITSTPTPNSPEKTTIVFKPARIEFPYGLSSFSDVYLTANTFSVDKTMYIKRLEEIKTRAILSLRPRRFGKTLWLNTLAMYYDIKYKDEFMKHFGNLAIGKDPTPSRSTYHVLFLDFSGMSKLSCAEFEAKFNNKLLGDLTQFRTKYSMQFSISNDGVQTFARMTTELRESHGQLYVMIDEYDTSFTATLETRVQEARQGLQLEISEMKNFFSVLKAQFGQNQPIGRCFITGVAPIALTEFSSGFNIAFDITTDLAFEGLYGFNTEELKRGLALIQPALPTKYIESI